MPPTMGTLYLVRHGQASFGSADYDNLSELGTRQCRRLGEYFHARGRRFDAVFTGTLRRQVQSYAAIAAALPAAPAAVELPGLNEYDSHAVVHAIHPQPLPSADTPERVRQHFRLLREGLAQWMSGRSQPQGMPTFEQFSAGVVAALDRVRSQHNGDVLIVSSGGPIATAVSHVLGAPALTTIELNMRIRNSALTEFAFTPKRHALVSFNAIPHLEDVDPAGWVTYA
jgi:broad specificity phosphatase PhoE